ncbi:hypothetical protein FHW37_102227 [Neorhizobium alkalisoli]|uniref:Addiction module component n=1 Tax=Neorhizobium alkalisoli TaxID=528178 RepID=A0A561R1W2_9HYPH|nr:hypothetical protein FHW37_102227 [Neorhizobium alkalisoli]
MELVKANWGKAVTIGATSISRYSAGMSETKGKISFKDLTAPAEGQSTDADYLAWKEAKIRKALKQAEDRSLMVPAEEVWKRFGFER